MKLLYTLTLTILFFSGTAQAYLDPGTGSIILQGILAGIFAVGAFWRHIKMFIGNFSKKIKKSKNVRTK